jgi:exosome complex component RRP41
LSKKRVKLISKKGIRSDKRRPDELRPISIEVGTLDKADGSSYIEWGGNKILVAVYGPRELHPRHLAMSDRALLRCRYHMAPFSVDERKSPAPSRREIELSKVTREALEPATFTELYPRTVIDVFIEILQADGGTRCAGITAASVALADAGVPMRDLVAACAAGKIEDKIVLDLNDVEDKVGEADLPIAVLPQSGEISLMQMDGRLSAEEFQEAFKMASEGCMKVYEIQKDALKKKYVTISAELEEIETEEKEDEEE